MEILLFKFSLNILMPTLNDNTNINDNKTVAFKTITMLKSIISVVE